MRKLISTSGLPRFFSPKSSTSVNLPPEMSTSLVVVQSPSRPSSSDEYPSERSASTTNVRFGTSLVTARISFMSVRNAASRLVSPTAYTITVQVPAADTSPAIVVVEEEGFVGVEEVAVVSPTTEVPPVTGTVSLVPGDDPHPAKVAVTSTRPTSPHPFRSVGLLCATGLCATGRAETLRWGLCAAPALPDTSTRTCLALLLGGATLGGGPRNLPGPFGPGALTPRFGGRRTSISPHSEPPTRLRG